MMKKLMLTGLLCLGVGLTLMASPARVSDDNDSQAASHSGRNGSVTAVTVQPQNPVSPANARIKYEFTGRAIDVSKLDAPKLKVGGGLLGRFDFGSVIHQASGDILKKRPIIDDPIDPGDPGAHENGKPGIGRVSVCSNDPYHSSTR